MGRFVLRRLVGMVAVLFAVSVLTFLIFNVIPNSDPARSMAGRNPNPALVASRSPKSQWIAAAPRNGRMRPSPLICHIPKHNTR